MYIAIEGVIGVGKTTLAQLLQPAFESALLLEVFEENPFLSDFYADRARYAFQTQIFFLLSRYYQQRRAAPQILAEGRNLISDYTFEKDALFARINLGGDELEMYYKVHQALAEKIPPPDLIVYLRASPDVLMQRIAFHEGMPMQRLVQGDVGSGKTIVAALAALADGRERLPGGDHGPDRSACRAALAQFQSHGCSRWGWKWRGSQASSLRRTGATCWS